MPSFFDLQKYAATGIASADMTAFDKMRALAAFGGGAVKTLTGIPPLTFKADGTPLISWSMKGNGSQSGTPTPDAPIMPTFCGVRNGNLLDESTSSDADATHINYNKTAPILLTAGQTYTFSCDTACNGLYIRSASDDSNLASINNASTLTYTPQVNVSAYCRVWNSNGITNLKPMLNLGSTALPYEPYGWKIPITCAGQTVPVYLGQTQTVRRIKKLVLTGEENITFASEDTNRLVGFFTIPGMGMKSDETGYCNILLWKNNYSQSEYNRIVASGSTRFYLSLEKSILPEQTIDGFKSYLASEYAAGTPVTVWYVLATPTTGIVNEPLAKIGDYADELHSEDAGVTIPTARGNNVLTIDSDLQPSEMTITFKG